MAGWTSQRLAALRHRSTELRERVQDPIDAATDAIGEAQRVQAAAYATGLNQREPTGYHPEATAPYDPHAETDL